MKENEKHCVQKYYIYIQNNLSTINNNTGKGKGNCIPLKDAWHRMLFRRANRGTVVPYASAASACRLLSVCDDCG